MWHESWWKLPKIFKLTTNLNIFMGEEPKTYYGWIRLLDPRSDSRSNISHFDRNISKNIGIFLHQDIPAPKITNHWRKVRGRVGKHTSSITRRAKHSRKTSFMLRRSFTAEAWRFSGYILTVPGTIESGSVERSRIYAYLDFSSGFIYTGLDLVNLWKLSF